MPYRACTTDEADIGMRYYLSSTDGTGGRLKSTAQDFIVREISNRPPEKEGRFTIADVTSTNWETNRLVRLLARGTELDNAIPFGKAHRTELWDYPQGINTMDFLINLKNEL